MNFFDEDPMALPRDAQYYFNIVVRTIGVNPQYAEKYLGDNVDEICFLDKLTDPRPQMFYFFIDDELDKDMEYEIESYPHCVVEVSEQLGVSWWEMIDFDTEDPWRIDLNEEDCD